VRIGARAVILPPANAGNTMNKAKHDWTQSDAMTDEQIEAAALADPDAQPMTEAQLARKPMARSNSPGHRIAAKLGADERNEKVPDGL